MSLTITEPIKTVQALLTKAIAALSQLLYLVQREDYAVVSTGAGAGTTVRVVIADTTDFTDGDAIYLSTDIFDQLTTVVDVFSATQLDVDIVYASVGGAGYVNNLSTRLGYHVELQVFGADDVALFDAIFEYVPNQAGYVPIDVGKLLALYQSDAHTFTLSKEYYLKLKERWNDQVSPTPTIGPFPSDATNNDGSGFTKATWWTDGLIDDVQVDDWYFYGNEDGSGFYNGIYKVKSVSLSPGFNNIVFDQLLLGGGSNSILTAYAAFPTTDLQSILGRKQLLKLGGANMWEYLLRGTAIASDNSKGKFLTLFTNPVMWRGWDVELSFLVDQNMALRLDFTASEVNLNQADTDVNKTLIYDAGQTVIDASETGVYSPDIDDQDLSAAPAYYRQIYIADAGNEQVSDYMYLEIRDECPEPIMVDWINSLGGVGHWLFGISQDVTNTVGEGVLAEQVIDSDIEFVTRTKQRFPGPRVQRIMLKAEKLTRDQVSALDELKRTSNLRVHLSKDGDSFIDVVVVNTFTTTGNTKYPLFDFNMEIEFPDDFDFFRGKLY
jgi:hypothetical protein